jgi:hypothetical protein
MLFAVGQCEMSLGQATEARQDNRTVDSLPTSRVSQTDTSECRSGRAARKLCYASFGPGTGRIIFLVATSTRAEGAGTSES